MPVAWCECKALKPDALPPDGWPSQPRWSSVRPRGADLHGVHRVGRGLAHVRRVWCRVSPDFLRAIDAPSSMSRNTGCGCCRSRGRAERAHRSVENRTVRGFPQRPQPSSSLVRKGSVLVSERGQKILSLDNAGVRALNESKAAVENMWHGFRWPPSRVKPAHEVSNGMKSVTSHLRPVSWAIRVNDRI